MSLNPVIEKFYLSILDYSGLKVDDNIIVNANEKIGDITIDGKHLALPYFSNLKNPNGKLIFHPLNENYTNPETTAFNLYKKRLVLELNLRLSSLIINLINLSSDPQLQQKIKSSSLVEIISNIGEVDHSLIENLMSVIKNSKKVNEEAFILDIFLKKNGSIDDVPYAAIGKVNFLLYNEVSKSLEDKEREYKVYGYKLRKKDLLALTNIFNIIFPDITNKDIYVEGTDNKTFRYLNVLIKTTYLITNRINNIISLLNAVKEPSIHMEDFVFNHDWVECLEELYGMSSQIRLIPNQDDVIVESTRLHVDESKAKEETLKSPPIFRPQQQVNQQPQTETESKVLSPEDIIRNSGNYGIPQMAPQMMPQMYQPQIQAPQWVQRETMRPVGTPGVMQPQMWPQGQMAQPQMWPQGQMAQPQMWPQGQMAQPQMWPQGQMAQPQMWPPQAYQSDPSGNNAGIPINPTFLQR